MSGIFYLYELYLRCYAISLIIEGCEFACTLLHSIDRDGLLGTDDGNLTSCLKLLDERNLLIIYFVATF